MDLKLKFNKARKLMSDKLATSLSFKTTEDKYGIKTEILLGNTSIILSVGFVKYTGNLQEDYLNSMLDAIANYDISLIEN